MGSPISPATVTDSRFKPTDKPQPQFLLAEHPTESPPGPIARFDPHAAANGFAFAPSEAWGEPTDAFIALFGDFTPATGSVSEPVGVEVVRVDTTSGEISTFLSNKNSGASSTHSAGGLEHPSDVTFGPDGAMYVTDWGIANITLDGLKLEPNTGVIWRVRAGAKEAGLPGGISMLYTLLVTVLLAAVTLSLLGGNRLRLPLSWGLWAGVTAGLVMGTVAMLASTVALNLPWYAPPRVFATMVMGRSAVANILEFVWPSFLLGLGVVVVLGALFGILFTALGRRSEPWRILLGALFYGLAVWSLLQYLLLPPLFPLVAEKGFPPFWYGVAFAVYGVSLGLLATLQSPARSEGGERVTAGGGRN